MFADKKYLYIYIFHIIIPDETRAYSNVKINSYTGAYRLNDTWIKLRRANKIGIVCERLWQTVERICIIKHPRDVLSGVNWNFHRETIRTAIVRVHDELTSVMMNNMFDGYMTAAKVSSKSLRNTRREEKINHRFSIYLGNGMRCSISSSSRAITMYIGR